MPNIEGLNEHMVAPQPVETLVPVDRLEGTLQGANQIGAGAFRVSPTTIALNDFTVAAGKFASSVYTVTFEGIGRTLPIPMFTMYVDNNLDDGYIWPNGANIATTEAAGTATIPRVSFVHDHDRGFFNGGQYVYCVTVENRSSSTQHYYQRLRWLLPVASGNEG